MDFEEARRRADLILELQAPIMDAFCEGYDEESGMYCGRSYADSPEIDGQVLFDGPGREGEIQPVYIESTEDGLLCGHLKEGE